MGRTKLHFDGPVQQRLPGHQPTHRNHRLFSDYYLNDLLPKQPEWEDREGLGEAFAAIELLFRKGWKGLRTANEAQTEKDFVQPVLTILGHVFDVRAGLKTIEGHREPDYVFFESDKVKDESAPKRNTRAYYDLAVGLGDAKRWERPLDKRVKESSEDYFSNSNPNFQMNSYLGSTGLRWGILTNGRLWRLYHTDKSRDLSTYYEVDLVELLAEGSEESFKYFYLFFRPEALVRDAESKCFLDGVLEARERYAQGVGEGLKRNVYEALRFLAQGFLTFPGNGLSGGDLEEIRYHCLTLLYRLLFISFAENRGLLPMDNPEYANRYSLETVKREIAAEIESRREFLREEDAYWSRLKRLFGLIDKGSDKLGVPAYNGGLFDGRQHPFLEKQGIGDEYLAKAVDRVARARPEGGNGLEAVDYGSLEVRHLGSIYEGLLEHRLVIAEEEKAVVKEKGRELVIPAGEAGGKKVVDTYQAGQVYPVTDRGERKATGSYYTPDYIVKYIVENTLGPLVEGCKRPAEILNLRVLDPAMGSGHFLVEATDYLARALERRYSEEGDGSTTLTTGGGVAIGTAELKRQVVERCIYGVDLNPLAVELAKVSLWLHTAAKGKALSFLDHHLKCGNSPIGAWMKDLGFLPERRGRRKEEKAAEGQERLIDLKKFETDISLAVTDMRHLEEMPGDRREDIKSKETFYEGRVRPRAKSYREIADLWCSSWFGNEMGPNDYDTIVEWRQTDLTRTRADLRPELHNYLRNSRSLAEGKRFFHWELEFPEVFFDGDGQPKGSAGGFHAVIGNPPWVESKFLGERDKGFYARQFITMHGQYDVFNAFVERGRAVLRLEGRFGMIVPNRFCANPDYAGLRRFLADVYAALNVKDYGDGVFPDVSMPSCILLAACKSDHRVMDIISRGGETYSVGLDQVADDDNAIFRLDSSPAKEKVIRRCFEQAVSLQQLYTNARGVEVGKDSRVVSDTQLGNSVAFGLGEDLSRYVFTPSRRLRLGDPTTEYKPLSLYQGSKILVRKTGHGINATVDESGSYVIQVIYIFKKRPSALVGDLFVLAVLNSRLLYDVYYSMFGERTKETFPHLRQGQFLELPIRRIAFTTPKGERGALVQQGKSLYEACVNTTDYQALLDFVSERLSSDPEQSDVVHDLLAFLAERMIEMNKEKQGEVRGFLEWLEGQMGAKVDDLTGKTKIRDYHEVEFGELLDILKKNRRKLGAKADSRNFQETLKAEFEKSVGKLGPLKGRIELTDRLIDEIVYRLYGLTEEEVAIVEGGK